MNKNVGVTGAFTRNWTALKLAAREQQRSVRRSDMSKGTNWDELRIDVRTLHSDHLGHAIDLLRYSQGANSELLNSTDDIHRQRFAISAIMHGFSSLEASLNYMAYHMFTLQDAAEYISKEKRDFSTQSMVKRWANLRITEKCNLILSSSDGSTMPNQTQSQLSELNNLRNWIVHGISYHSTLLVAPTPDVYTEFIVVDEEPGASWKDWNDKFPLCRFNEPLALNHSDAQTALRVIIETLLLLSQRTGFRWFYNTYVPSFAACGIGGNIEVNVDKIFGVEVTEQSDGG